mgnify:CR=1 FL=1
MWHRDSDFIRQLARGLYDYPKIDPQLGSLQPSTDDIASALAGRDATRLQPSGAYAANLLGLSTQVPMKVVYLTDGRSRTVQVGKRQIILKHTTPRNMATAGKIQWVGDSGTAPPGPEERRSVSYRTSRSSAR